MRKPQLTGVIEEYGLVTFCISVIKVGRKCKDTAELHDLCACGWCWWNCSGWWSFKPQFKTKKAPKQLHHTQVTVLPCAYCENTQVMVGPERQMLLQVCQCLAVPLQTNFSKSSTFSIRPGFLKSGFHWRFALICAFVWKSDSKTP